MRQVGNQERDQMPPCCTYNLKHKQDVHLKCAHDKKNTLHVGGAPRGPTDR